MTEDILPALPHTPKADCARFSQFSWKCHLVMAGFALLAVLVLKEFTELDFWVQSFIYHDAWPLPRKDFVLKLVFHEIPRVIIVGGGGVLLILTLLSRFVEKLRRFRTRKHLFLALSLTMVPLLIGLAKNASHTYCPYQLVNYGGDFTYLSLADAITSGAGGHCFPAGHVSVGFALMAFIFLARSKAEQVKIAAGTIGFAWVLGAYQMLNGNHFLTHTLTTMILAWMAIILIHRAVFGGKTPPLLQNF